jgi:hypothetical protein
LDKLKELVIVTIRKFPALDIAEEAALGVGVEAKIEAKMDDLL